MSRPCSGGYNSCCPSLRSPGRLRTRSNRCCCCSAARRLPSGGEVHSPPAHCCWCGYCLSIVVDVRRYLVASEGPGGEGNCCSEGKGIVVDQQRWDTVAGDSSSSSVAVVVVVVALLPYHSFHRVTMTAAPKNHYYHCYNNYYYRTVGCHCCCWRCSHGDDDDFD